MASKPKVIVNSTPLIVLGNTGQVELLHELFGEVTIPEAVYREATFKDDYAARFLLQSPTWINVEKAPTADKATLLPARLHAGEVEVILLAKLKENSMAVLDEGAARKTASYLGLRVTGTLGILVAAKQRGLIDRLAPCVEELRECAGFRLSETVVRQALKAAGEL